MSVEFDVQKVAALARLKLTPEEEVALSKKFAQVLDYVGMLSDLQIKDEAQDRDESLLNRNRVDETSPSGIKLEDFSSQVENGHFKVPSVIE
ncbi:MAG: Asp-tRNA(Asn)/Glu-tRNA(Gln) amidotransferase subunit GatC [bacterium]|nr:Asp-tRNA(Asn)/Glu-tRNA(Gln) amidotransferase subunit GatC [bacterium]